MAEQQPVSSEPAGDLLRAPLLPKARLASSQSAEANLTPRSGPSPAREVVPIGAAATTWQHIAVTYDGTLRRQLASTPARSPGRRTVALTLCTYLNGSFVATGTWAGLGSTLGFEIAKIGINRDAGLAFNGLVDEVEIYDRALSASEIQDIYDAGGDKCKP